GFYGVLIGDTVSVANGTLSVKGATDVAEAIRISGGGVAEALVSGNATRQGIATGSGGDGVDLDFNGTVTAGSGNITITGVGSGAGIITGGGAGAVIGGGSTSGNITLIMDNSQLGAFGTGTNIQTTGNITVKPYTT